MRLPSSNKQTPPQIIAGGGANHSAANDAIQTIAEWLAAPVVTTISGQGLIPDDHPLSLGVIGDNGFHPHAHQAIEESDTYPITRLPELPAESCEECVRFR